MLSILIPVHDYDATDLVSGLHDEAKQLATEVEIVVIDDGSNLLFKKNNRQLSNLELVRYEELEKNIGRSAIRNYLAKKAKYEYLVFLDCDMGLLFKNFIKNYIDKINADNVLVGGLTYQAEKPKNDQILHWKVGQNREVKSVEQRVMFPYNNFLSSNFLIPKSIFKKIKFDESLKQYGHEDTLFGLELKKMGVSVNHIDNPLQHNGLEQSDKFLEKSKNAIENLEKLYKQNKISPTKLIATHLKIKRLKMDWLIYPIIKFFKSSLIKNLKGRNPNLRYFDIYKLHIYNNVSQIIKNID